jgi:hypothetical protein
LRRIDSLKRKKFKNNGVPHLAGRIWGLLDAVVLKHKLSAKDQATIVLLEQQKVTSILTMFLDGSVSRPEGHVPLLAFSEVLKHSIGPLTIGISMRGPRSASYDDNRKAGLTWRDDPSLLLTSKSRMDI